MSAIVSQPIRALIVDDDADFLVYLTEMLKSLNVVSTPCKSFRQFAAELVCDPGYQILFVDIVMGEFDGIQVIEQLGKLSVRARVVVMSESDPQVLEAASRVARLEGLQVAGTLRKPFWADDVAAILYPKCNESTQKQSHLPDLSLKEVDQALENRRIVMQYQPKVDVIQGEVVGVEALARLRSPNGLIFPAQFIAAMESTELMKKFAERMLETVLADFVQFQSDGLSVNVAINVGINLLEEGDCPDIVRAGCKRFGVSPTRLTLEITERSITENIKTVLSVATRLRILGAGLSIDDFGTSFSSVERLRNLPFSELKIDRSLISKCSVDPHSKSRCENIVKMAKQLGLKVVAEGVETDREFRSILAAGCSTIQGFYICRPMAAQDLPGWVRRWNHSNSHQAVGQS